MKPTRNLDFAAVGTGDKARRATFADVTHIEGILNQKPTAWAEGKLIFRGIVK